MDTYKPVGFMPAPEKSAKKAQNTPAAPAASSFAMVADSGLEMGAHTQPRELNAHQVRAAMRDGKTVIGGEHALKQSSWLARLVFRR
jgi:hypothetical protein